MRAILHIGTEKTGTTSIQEMLYLNRDALAERKILFPKTFGDRDHRLLACYLDRRPFRLYTELLNIKDDVERSEFRVNLIESFHKELTAASYSGMILSSEHLHSHLQTKAQLIELKNVVQEVCDEIFVLVYFRRQDQMAVSRYSTALKAGKLPEIHFQNVNNWVYKYLESFQLWSECFGEENVVARCFENGHFVNGDLLDDFLSSTTFALKKSELRLPQKRNESLSQEAECLLIILNELVKTGDLELPKPVRQRIIVHIMNQFPGNPRLPARKDAEDFYRHFHDHNEALAKSAGWGTVNSFSADFSNYPVQSDPKPSMCEKWAHTYLKGLIATLG